MGCLLRFCNAGYLNIRLADAFRPRGSLYLQGICKSVGGIISHTKHVTKRQLLG